MKGIYKITNIVNNKVYIGQSNNLDRRLDAHRRLLRNNKHVNVHLQNSWNKYGECNFRFDIIYEADLDTDINLLEKDFIRKFLSNDQRYGYNATSGGEGYALTDEIKQKISVNGRGKNTKLSIDEVRNIKMLLYLNMSRNEISEIFNVSNKVLTQISTGKNFYYVLPYLNEDIHYLKQKMINERNLKIIDLHNKGKGNKDIMEELNITASIVEKCIYKHCKTNKNYKARKLSESKESEIIFQHFTQGIAPKDIALDYNVSLSTIYLIINNYKYTHMV